MGVRHLELGVEGQRHGRVLGCWIGVGQRPAERAPVADLEMTDEWRRSGQKRHGTGHRRVTLDLGLASHGSDAEGAVPSFDTTELVHPVEIDDVVEPGQSQRHDRHQALAPGQHLGLVAEVAEEAGDVGHLLGSVVLEGGRLHFFLFFRRRRSSQ